MKLLSIQQFSLYGTGGGSRILRRLYEGKEKDVVSICVVQAVDKNVGPIQESKIISYPIHKKWMRFYLRTIATWLRYKVLYHRTLNKLIKSSMEYEYDTIHIVDHWNFPPSFISKLIEAVIGKKKFWVSFHDHFNSAGGFKETSKVLWTLADRRLVISQEIGEEYQKLFGKRKFEIITDGVALNEISVPMKIDLTKKVVIYFAGLLHNDYYPLFKILADTLEALSKQNCSFKLLLRGTQKLDFLNNRTFDVEYRPFTLHRKELADELNQSDILYLPIKFTNPYFYKYSLSTKMIGYLAAPGTILYHGPGESAANHLLADYKAAVTCTSLSKEDLVQAILQINSSVNEYSSNAKELVKGRFLLSDIQYKFWNK